MQDIISREIMVEAKKEQVYDAITNPSQIVKWFPDAIEGSFVVGEQPLLVFEGHGKSQIYIEKSTPHEYFSYRWVPGGNGVVGVDVLTIPTTLVEFIIEEQADGTKVTVKESGFASLPKEYAEQSFEQNSGGWKYMIERLEALMNQS